MPESPTSHPPASLDHPDPSDGAQLAARPIVAIYVATLLMSCSLGFNGTQTSLYLAENGQSAETIGFLATIYNLALLVTGLLIPAIVSRYGTVGVCVLGALGMALGAVIFPWMTGFWGWMAARVLFGVGVAGIWIAGESALNLLTPARMQIRVLTLYGIFFALGFSLGPALSAALDSTAPSAFWYGGLLALCAAVPFFWLRNKLSSPPAGRGRISVQRAFLRYKPSMLLAFLSGAVESIPLVLLPVYGLQIGLPHRASALLITSFVAGGMLLTLLFGWWSEKTRSGQVFISVCVFGLILLPGWLILADTVQIGGSFHRYAALFVLGGAAMALYPLGLARLVAQLPRGQIVEGNAAFIVSYQIGSTVGPGMAGVMTDRVGPGGSFWVMATIALMYGLLSFRLRASGGKASHL